jgi:non-ribosomal peptide synthetase-like protein
MDTPMPDLVGADFSLPTATDTSHIRASLASVFTSTAALHPGKTAFRFRDTTITYGALDLRTNRWAALLRDRGIGPGQFVGVWVDRSIELHAAILAILKTGAAYLPFDPAAPRDRVETSLDDCAATAILVDAAHAPNANGLSAPVVTIESLDAARPVEFVPIPPDPDGPAYAIYTSGSTGKPKGIAVSQRNICHLLHVENQVLGVTEADIVYQGFSPAFDMSLEEVFVSYSVGATLVIAPEEMVRAADRLPAFLRDAGVTILHCVPTLLAMLDEDVASIRLINMGGEACPAALVDRWWRPDRILFNTYGPTETTVTATGAKLRPGEPITIGHPLPNYTSYIVDETTLQPVPHGASGELLIGGPGVAIGYIGRPDLTAQKFIDNPLEQAAASDPRVYRTGDKASYDAEGRIIFHGRLDDQVKFRGYRIETGEIEAELGKLDEVRAAAVVLREDVAGTQHLVAFIAAPEGQRADPKAIREALGKRLPAYMLPTLFKTIDVVPRLPSGKINRKALPDLTEAVEMDDSRAAEPPATPIEAALQAAWQAQFPHMRVGVTDDFFLDLGGHSLLAAGLVSRLRQDPRFLRVSIQDLYNLRTIRALASGQGAGAAKAEAVPPFAPVPRLRHMLCGAAQAVALIPIYGMLALLIIVPYLVFSALMEFGHGLPLSILGTMVSFVATPPLITAVGIATKWLVIGRFRAGDYPLWGLYYFRWWFVTRMLGVLPAAFMADTPAQALYCRLLGARIGRDVHLGSVLLGAADLVRIDDGAAVGNDVRFANASVEGGLLRLGTIEVGADAYIGSRTVVEGDTVIGAHGELDNLSALRSGSRIPAGEIWRGSPAAFHENAAPAPLVPEPSQLRRIGFDVALCLVMLIFPVVAFMPLVPGMVIFDQIYDARWEAGVPLPLVIPGIALLYIVLVLTEIVALRWLLLGRVKEGSHPVRSAFYLRKWFVDHLMDMALGEVHAIYASLYVVPWLRLLGMKIGRRAEVSTAASITHDLVEIGEEAFIADGVMLGDAEIRRGVLTLRRTVVGRRSFIGNSGFLPDGSTIPDECLVGVLSIPPGHADKPLGAGQTCLGTPSFILPNRQSFLDHSQQLTFRPGPARVAARLFVEGCRIVLPPLVFITLLGYTMEAFDQVYDHHGLLVSYLSVPFIYVLHIGFPVLLIVAALKWVAVRRYRSVEVPMWTLFVWLSEAVTAVYEGLTVPMLLAPLRGTPFLPWAWKLFGVQVGRRIFTDTTDITEFDMVSIGDDAALNDACGPQTHLFEDRVMKVGPVHIGARTVLGTNAIVLYGASIGDDAAIGSLSLVMKGEAIPPGTVWAGSPARARA